MEAFKRDLREDITQILYDQTKRTPIVIPVVNEINGGAATKRAEIEQKRRSDNFEKQELARLRGQNSAHFVPRRTASTSQSPGRPVQSARGLDTNAAKSPPRSAQEISFKKHPSGPSPMKMWRE
jgi:hypothetical protein